MEDLYKIERPFGLLDKETQDAVRKCEEAEFYGAFGEWCPKGSAEFIPSVTYRCKPKPYLPGVLYGWEGGPQPIPDHWLVQVVVHSGYVFPVGFGARAGNLEWGHYDISSDIIAFVILRQD